MQNKLIHQISQLRDREKLINIKVLKNWFLSWLSWLVSIFWENLYNAKHIYNKDGRLKSNSSG